MSSIAENDRTAFYKNFYSRLKEVMEKHEVTIGELVTEVHCPAYFIEALVKGECPSPIGIITVSNICKYCNCSADYLLGLSDNIS